MLFDSSKKEISKNIHLHQSKITYEYKKYNENFFF